MPLTKAAAKDFFKDRLKNSASRRCTCDAGLFKKAVKQSQKNFFLLFQDELENRGWTSSAD